MPSRRTDKRVRKLVKRATGALAEGVRRALRPRKRPRQCAALPYRTRNGALQVLLITRRSNAEWIIPKGQVEPRHTEPESALLEAEEEAGVTGRIGQACVGTFRYRKWGRTRLVAVYDLPVGRQLTDWPERLERERRWVPVKEAAGLVASRGLARLIRRLPDRLAADKNGRAADSRKDND